MAKEPAPDLAAGLEAELDYVTRERAALAASSQELRRSLAASQDASRKLEKRYDSLLSRRVVRLSLAAVRFLGPLIRGLRSLRKLPSTGARAAATAGSDPGLDSTAPPPGPAPTSRPISGAAILRLLHGDSAPPRVTVIVPIYNAADELSALVASLQRHVHAPDQIILIDDASPDPRIASILKSIDDDRFTILRNDANAGFTATVNRGLLACETDVVILNSDTVVGPKWLRNLQVTAYSSPRTAIVSPLSDNAGVFSAPSSSGSNTLPEGMDWDDAARAVTRGAGRLRPAIPTGHGFCMYVRRDALDEVGLLDEESFPRGYGEETDFSLRARAAGWLCVLEDRTYVHHVRAASFGTDRDGLIAQGRTVVEARYPDYAAQVAELKRSPAIATSRENVGRALTSVPPTARRVLSVLHDGGGGTPQTNRDLMRALGDGYEARILRSTGTELSVQDAGTGEVTWRRSISEPWQLMHYSHPELLDAYADLLESWDVDLLHIRHLIRHSFDLPRVAKALRVPVVLSLHDYYLSCPTIHLLDEERRHCGGVCTAGPGPCTAPGNLGPHPDLKHAWIHRWRAKVAEMFGSVDQLVTTSHQTVKIYERSFAGVDLPPIQVIEHGRDFPKRIDAASPPDPAEPLRVLLLGNIGRNKGGDVLEEVKQRDAAGDLDLHFLGDVAPYYRHLGTLHGLYDRDDVLGRIAVIRPHVVAILSTGPETYCHTLTEAWAAGVPVVASNLGALHDRVERQGGGWLVDVTDVPAVHDTFLRIRAGELGWELRHREALDAEIKSIDEMAADYRALYEELLAAAP